MQIWAILGSVLADLLYKMGNPPDVTHARAEPSAIYTSAGGVATINIVGPLLKGRNAMLDAWGYTYSNYADIKNDIAAAENDKSVKRVEFAIDSPGGTVDGWFEAMDAVKNMTKPTTARVLNMAASAAYGLASQADTIQLAHKAATVGSIGVVVDAYVSDDIVSVTSTNAPKKRHDLKTEDGKAALREELDQYEALFLDAVATGRDVSVDKVKKDYGKGGMLIGANAIAAGMADGFSTTEATGRGTTSATQEKSHMTLDELKAAHPELYKQILALGVTQERDRVNGHLEAAADVKAAMPIAIEAIKAGENLTQTHFGKYLAAARNENDINADVTDAAPDLVVVDQDAQKLTAKEACERATLEMLGIE